MIGKGEPAVGADPVVPGQLHGNPSFHALALDEDDLLLHRRGQWGFQTFGELLGQDLQAIARIEFQSSHDD